MINLDILTRPFSQEEVKRRKNDAGKTFDYVEAHSVITRLNEAFEGAWSFRVVQQQMVEEEIIAGEDGIRLGNALEGDLTKADASGLISGFARKRAACLLRFFQRRQSFFNTSKTIGVFL